MEPLLGLAAAVLIAIAAAFVLSEGRGTPRAAVPGGQVPGPGGSPPPKPSRQSPSREGMSAQPAKPPAGPSIPGPLSASTPIDSVPEMTSFTLDLDLGTARFDRFAVVSPEPKEPSETTEAA